MRDQGHQEPGGDGQAAEDGALSLEPILSGGSRRHRFLRELASHSAVFPVANILLEYFLEGGPAYFLEADFYAISLAALVQAAWLSAPGEPRGGRLLGNLLGPALYTAIELAVEGPRFFQAPHHVAYWVFALVLGSLQQARAIPALARGGEALLIAENLVRSSILFVMYAIHELLSGPPGGTLAAFWDDPSHRFIAIAVALLGLLTGLAAVNAERYLEALRGVSRQLRLYSEWFFGPALLREALEHPERLALARRERAVLFMDIRGFTAWSETQSPEAVVALLTRYYTAAEGAFARFPPIRSKFSADEVMAAFADAAGALGAARALQGAAGTVLDSAGLGAGVGLHWGPVVEGLMGAAGIKYFDVIGDTVNTAKRLEGAAARGEIVASAAFCAAANVPGEPDRAITAKGKAQPIPARALPSA